MEEKRVTDSEFHTWALTVWVVAAVINMVAVLVAIFGPLLRHRLMCPKLKLELKNLEGLGYKSNARSANGQIKVSGTEGVRYRFFSFSLAPRSHYLGSPIICLVTCVPLSAFIDHLLPAQPECHKA